MVISPYTTRNMSGYVSTHCLSQSHAIFSGHLSIVVSRLAISPTILELFWYNLAKTHRSQQHSAPLFPRQCNEIMVTALQEAANELFVSSPE